MEITVLDKYIYKIERPIDVDKIENDLRRINNLLAPGKLSLEQYEEFVRELANYRITVNTPDDICTEVIMYIYKNPTRIPTSDDVVEHIMQFNYMLESYIADALLCIKLEKGEISSHSYINDYDFYMEEIQEEFAYDFYYYGYSIENIISSYIKNNAIALTTDYISEYAYCENIKIDDEFMAYLEKYEESGDIILNDCQEILIDELAEYGFYRTSDSTLGFRSDRLVQKNEIKMIGDR